MLWRLLVVQSSVYVTQVDVNGTLQLLGGNNNTTVNQNTAGADSDTCYPGILFLLVL